MLPTWDDLALFHVDLHYHAGTERPAGYAARAFIDFAIATGRRIIGATDHWGRFLGLSRKPLNHYPGTLDGYRAFAHDIAEAQDIYPDVLLLFGPEIGIPHFVNGTAEPAFRVPEVHYLMIEPGGYESGTSTYGEYLVEGIRAGAAQRDRCGKPCFLAHPLRAAVNRYVGKTGPGPQLPFSPPFAPLSIYSDPLSHVEDLLDIDIDALAEAAISYDVPLEINESSWGRIMGMNHASFSERHIYFFQSLIDRGTPVVLGSDQHNVESGAPTPFVLAEKIGLYPRDITFLRHWLGDAPDAEM